MVRDDKSVFLLFMEPKKEQRHGVAINDEFTSLLRMAIGEARIGKSNFNEPGMPPATFKDGNKHRNKFKCCDGQESTQQEFLFRNGLITHSLCIYYMMWYRSAITKNDWDKIKDLQRFYGRSQVDKQDILSNKKFM